MATLTTDKIISELNNYFENYQYVFWYDPDSEFNDIIDTIAASLHAKLYKAFENEQFKTKSNILADPKHKYLIYASYEHPSINKSYLTDMECYSKLFTADASKIIAEELNLGNSYIEFVKKYSLYFAAKARKADFRKYWCPEFETQPEKGILAAITKTEKLDINELLMTVMAAGFNDNKYIFEFSKYKVLNEFWQLIEDYFGYVSQDPSLSDLIGKLFLTYLSNELTGDLPAKIQANVLAKKDNVKIFIDRFADSNKYLDTYEELSSQIWHENELAKILSSKPLAELTKITIFEELNDLVLSKLRAKFNGQQVTDYEQILETIDLMLNRLRTNFDERTQYEYKFLRYAAELFNLKVAIVDSWQEELQNYLDEAYQVDTIYRKSLFAYNKIKVEKDGYNEIKNSLDRYYGNELLVKSVKQWNETFDLNDVPANLRQERFYYNYVAYTRERLVVIFSDAFRYEIAKELEEDLSGDDRLSLKMNHAITGLPSVTYIGMNTMLPHKKLSWNDATSRVKVDDKMADTTKNRDKILKTYSKTNLACQLKDVLKMTSKEVKELIIGKNVIYLYHNQIDTKGHDIKTASGELVDASERAIGEIKQTIQKLRTNGVSHIIVTADHGFIYQEKQIEASDKIILDQKYEGTAHLRYLITPSQIDIVGVKSTTLGITLNNDSEIKVYYPTSTNEFVANSGSKNYVHGGSSIQEMLIPVLDIKATSNRSQAKPAEIKLATTRFKINNLQMNLLFNQLAPISDLVKPINYQAYFTDDNDMLISNIVPIEANRVGSAADRTIAVTINIQNKNYDLNKDYYLVIESENGDKKKFKYGMDLFISNN